MRRTACTCTLRSTRSTTCILLLKLLLLLLLDTSLLAMSTTSSSSSVLVTGANGYLGSHIVKHLLSRGYTVHGAVRDATSHRAAHLLALDGRGGAAKDDEGRRLRLFSIGDLATATSATFDEAMNSCCAVIHVATPLNPKFAEDFDGERDIYTPALSSTRALLGCIEQHHGDTVRCLVLTSSMSAVAPHPEPTVKDESCWSDSDRQRSKSNWYGATKTDQERLVQEWVESARTRGAVAKDFRYAAICPTMIVGPALNGEVTGTMATLLGWVQGKKAEAPNDSMSFIHVEDCAAMHVAAMERGTAASGRYMSLVESWHWNDIAACLMELCPDMPAIKLYDGPEDRVVPTKFNLDRMKSLGVAVKPVRETLEDSLQYLKSVGALK